MDSPSKWASVTHKMIGASLTAGTSLIPLSVVSYNYIKYYNRLGLDNIERAFETGEPVSELAASSNLQRRRSSEVVGFHAMSKRRSIKPSGVLVWPLSSDHG